MRTTITTSVDTKTAEKLRQIKAKTGMSIGAQIDEAIAVYGVKKS
jgi:hypothetical protein